MLEALIVSTARTPLVKSNRSEIDITPGPSLASYAIRAAVDPSRLDEGLLDELIIGCGYPEGITTRNVGRRAVPRFAVLVRVAGATVNRFCDPGCRQLPLPNGRILVEGTNAVVAGGVESISQIQVRATDGRISPSTLGSRSTSRLSSPR